MLILESNLAYEAQHLMHALTTAGIRKWVAMSEGASGTLGWLTTHERKEAMCLALRDALRVGCIGLHPRFFSTSQPAADVVRTLGEELRAFSVLVEPPRSPFGKVKKTYSGKIGGRQDDLAITLQLAIIGTRTFYTSDRYASFRPVR